MLCNNTWSEMDPRLFNFVMWKVISPGSVVGASPCPADFVAASKNAILLSVVYGRKKAHDCRMLNRGNIVINVEQK